MEAVLQQAKDFWLKGDLKQSIKKLLQIFPANEALATIASSYEDNETSFLNDLIEPSAYRVGRQKIRLKLQEYFETTDSNIYKILYLSSNPTQLVQFNYGKEYEAITGALKDADNRSSFQVNPKFYAQKNDLYDMIKALAPKLVYVSLHGTNNNGLMFVDEFGRSDKLSLDELIAILKDVTGSADIDCIFFSACKSDEQAKAASAFVPFSIGMNKDIDDTAAIVFAEGFFRQLYNDPHKVEDAFNSGKMKLFLSNNPGIKECLDIPVLFKK